MGNSFMQCKGYRTDCNRLGPLQKSFGPFGPETPKKSKKGSAGPLRPGVEKGWKKSKKGWQKFEKGCFWVRFDIFSTFCNPGVKRLCEPFSNFFGDLGLTPVRG